MLRELLPSPERQRTNRTPKMLRRVGEATLDTLARFRMLPDDKESGRPLDERRTPQLSPVELGADVQYHRIRLRASRHSKAHNPALTPVHEIIDKAIPGLNNPRHLYTHANENGVNSAYQHLIGQRRR